MTAMLADLRLAARSLRRRPTFALVAITTITLAIAANVAIFSVVDAVLLRPLPFVHPERQVTIESRAPTGFLVSTSIPNLRDWRDRSRSFESYAGSAGWSFTLTGREAPVSVGGVAVVGDFFGTLGLRTVAGRTLTPGEAPAHAGGSAVAVLGHAFAVAHFGSAGAAVGQTLRLDGRPFSVVGVLAPGQGFPRPDIQLYLPMATIPGLPWDTRNSGFGTRVLARLAPGVSPEAARQDLERVGRELAREEGKPIAQPELAGLKQYYVGDIESRLWILMAAVGCVLLIAVSNVASLLVARGEDRQRELAVRVALGADRPALLRLLLAEALLLAGVGGGLGIVSARLAVRALVPLLPAEIPRLLVSRIQVNGTVVLVGLGLAALTALVFGLLPAFRVVRSTAASSFRGGGRTATGQRSRLLGTLVVIEVALATVLLASAGLMIRSFIRLSRVDMGFTPDHVLSAAPNPTDARLPNREAWHNFYARLRDRAAALPGVRSAALALLVPLSNRSWELGIWPEGMPVEVSTSHSVLYNVVSPEYFSTLGVPILRGRDFQPADRDGAPLVAIVDQTMAAEFWPGADPIGKRVTFERDSADAPIYRTVVGVTRNVRHYEVTSPSRIQVYVPFAQTGTRWGMNLRLLLTADHPMAQVPALRKLLAQMDPDAPLSQVHRVEDLVSTALAPNRAMTRVLAAFGAAALGLAALGIFGIMSYLVLRRSREIGIRMALGADRARIVRWVGGRAARLTGLGLGLGLTATLASVRVLRQALFEVSPLDPLTLVLATVTLAAAAGLAAWLPARRAARVDPVTVLGDEG